MLLQVLLLPTAHAACEAQLGKVGSLDASSVAAGWSELIKCDKKVAETSFNKYLEKATDEDALLALALVGIDAEVWNPVWSSLGKIASYEARDVVARRVGEACGEHPKVVSFLQGAYFGLRNVDFSQWDDAFVTCTDPKLADWIETQVAMPPKKIFDEKYSSVVSIFVKAERVDALPLLAAAAVKAAEIGGPFDDLLQQMGTAVQGDLGAAPDEAAQKALVDALVGVGQKVPVEQARSVANGLANAGAEGPAASLLPRLYPDRVQSGGGFLYGAAALEVGDCGGKKSLVLHYAPAAEAGKRWSILGDLEPVMRAVKPKLKDCTVESPWPVLHSPEPVKSAGDVDAWAEQVAKEWAGKGYEVKTQKEKAVSLP